MASAMRSAMHASRPFISNQWRLMRCVAGPARCLRIICLVAAPTAAEAPASSLPKNSGLAMLDTEKAMASTTCPVTSMQAECKGNALISGSKPAFPCERLSMPKWRAKVDLQRPSARPHPMAKDMATVIPQTTTYRMVNRREKLTWSVENGKEEEEA